MKLISYLANDPMLFVMLFNNSLSTSNMLESLIKHAVADLKIPKNIKCISELLHFPKQFFLSLTAKLGKSSDGFSSIRSFFLK